MPSPGAELEVDVDGVAAPDIESGVNESSGGVMRQNRRDREFF